MEFTVDRSKWRSGGDKANKIGKGMTSLVNEKGFMCCLGQTCSQLGVKSKDMFQLGEPGEIAAYKKYRDLPEIFFFKEGDRDFWGEGIYFYTSEFSEEAIEINDDETIGQRERERKLRELFKKHGHKLKFTGKAIKNKK